jgi:16S rRNA C967 or C1407 C5-methylase (RsmB/RsmF family)
MAALRQFLVQVCRQGWGPVPVLFLHLVCHTAQENETGHLSRQEAVSMIPALLLDVQPHHIVLDACSSPGSKTMQILEMIEQAGLVTGLERGLVIANDADFDRCLTLTHQAKRAESPSLLITHGDASRFPRLEIGSEGSGCHRATVFDRILCDVPCSGDGILRKTPDGWRTWGTDKANELHALQLAILRRALELVHVGGRVVYSTCALNPIENEAVVAAALNAFPGCVQLLDCSADLCSLKRRPGMSSWKLMHKLAAKKELVELSAESPASIAAQLAPFAPPPNASALALDRCMRIVPHDQNSSGFFVAVLLKTADCTPPPTRPAGMEPVERDCQAHVAEDEAEGRPRKKGKEAYYSSSDVMRMLSTDELTSLRTHLCDFYGIDERCGSRAPSACARPGAVLSESCGSRRVQLCIRTARDDLRHVLADLGRVCTERAAARNAISACRTVDHACGRQDLGAARGDSWRAQCGGLRVGQRNVPHTPARRGHACTAHAQAAACGMHGRLPLPALAWLGAVRRAEC